VKVATIQHDIVWEDRDATLARVEPLVRSAAAAGAGLVVLPELFAVGFSMATERIAEPADGPTTAWLVGQAAAHGVAICGSVPVAVAGEPRPANTFVLASPDGRLHRYAKRHPFSFAGEDRHYLAGSTTTTVEVDGVRLSPAICYDLRFADQFWGQAAGTDCYLVVANWPASRRTHWRALLVARAIENQAYVVGVNRVGSGDGLDYAGDSCIVDPLGEVLADAGATEGCIAADIDPALVADTRRRFPFMADRT
jgi:predicted amidohydrolase